MGMKRSAGIVSLAVIGSRLLGLVREVVFVALFGASKLWDSFLAAFQIPNLLRDLFAEGALSTAFTTTFTQTFEKEGAESAWRQARLVLSAILVLGGLVCLVGIVLSPWIVELTSHGFHQVPGKFELTVRLTRILFPFILFLSLASVVMGILNARFVFGWPAAASMFFNLISIIAGVVLAFVFEPQANLHALNFGERGLMGVSVGVLLGGLAQLCIQLPPLWRTGFKWSWTFNLSDAQLKQIWRLMLPSIVAGAAVQVNVLVNGIFASEINGARSWLNCAFRLMQFPIGVFGVAIATVTLPWVSRCRARGEHAGFGEAAGKSLRLAFFLTLPAALGLALIAPEVIQLIYEHGKFGSADTHATALALQAYAVGLAGYAAIKVLVPCFYALDRPSIPLRISLLGMGINLGLNLVFVKVCHWGHVGLALSTGGLAIVNFLQLFFALRRQVDLGRFREWLVFGAILSLMLVVCGLAVHNVRTVLHPAAAGDLWGQALRLCLMMAAGAGSYILAGSILKVEECRWIWTLITKIRSRPTRT